MKKRSKRANRLYCYHLKAFREALGLTQKQVATDLGQYNVLISLYECNRITQKSQESEIQLHVERYLNEVKDRRSRSKGAWYKRYIELETVLREINLYVLDKKLPPESVVEEAKIKAKLFVEG